MMMSRHTCLVILMILWVPLALIAMDGLGDEEGLDDMVLDADSLLSLSGAERKKKIAKIFAKPDKSHVGDLEIIVTQDKDPDKTVAKAIEILGEIGGEEVFPVAKRLLEMRDPSKQLLGLKVLGSTRSERGARLLVKLAPNFSRFREKNEHTFNFFDHDRTFSQQQEFRYQTARAFFHLGRKESLSILKAWAKDEPFSRLALSSSGDHSRFGQTLKDYERIKYGLDYSPWNYKFAHCKNAGEKRQAWALLQRHMDFCNLFEKFIAKIGKVRMRQLTEHLKFRHESAIPGSIYGKLADMIRPDNADAFLELMDAPLPNFQMEIARRLHALNRKDVRAKLQAKLLRKLEDANFEERAVVMQVSHILPTAERKRVIAAGIKEHSRYVLLEALKSLKNQPLEESKEYASQVLKDPRWQSDHLVLRQARMIRAGFRELN